jgi:hypothetical protein
VAENRRSAKRHVVSLPAKLVVGGSSIDCTIQNLSLGGALVDATQRHAMGERCQITFSVPRSDQPIEIGGTVRWADKTSVGIQFDGLRAREVWALNEYFKLLAG